MFTSNGMPFYTKLEHTFTGMRVEDGVLKPETWDITVNIVLPFPTLAQTERQHLLDCKVACEKLLFWLENSVNNAIIINGYDKVDRKSLDFYSTLNNPLIMCPGNPDDTLLLILFHSKINAITKGKLVIGEVTINSYDGYTHFFSCNDGNYGLPEVEGMVHTKPWWTRHDLTMMDYDKKYLTNDDIQTIIEDCTLLDEIEKQFVEQLEYTDVPVEEEPKEQLEIETTDTPVIKASEWNKPKVV